MKTHLPCFGIHSSRHTYCRGNRPPLRSIPRCVSEEDAKRNPALVTCLKCRDRKGLDDPRQREWLESQGWNFTTKEA